MKISQEWFRKSGLKGIFAEHLFFTLGMTDPLVPFFQGHKKHLTAVFLGAVYKKIKPFFKTKVVYDHFITRLNVKTLPLISSSDLLNLAIAYYK